MKRTLSVILTILLVLILTSCNDFMSNISKSQGTRIPEQFRGSWRCDGDGLMLQITPNTATFYLFQAIPGTDQIVKQEIFDLYSATEITIEGENDTTETLTLVKSYSIEEKAKDGSFFFTREFKNEKIDLKIKTFFSVNSARNGLSSWQRFEQTVNGETTVSSQNNEFIKFIENTTTTETEETPEEGNGEESTTT